MKHIRKFVFLAALVIATSSPSSSVFAPFDSLNGKFNPFAASGGIVVQSLTNAQKLALDPVTTPIGKQVSVTDGFVVSGAGTTSFNDFYFASGTSGGRTRYEPLSYGSTGNECLWNGASSWILSSFYYSDNVAEPWLGTWTKDSDGDPPVPTLTHPAIQQLTAPSTAQGGVFVSGGTQDGVYTKRGQWNSKDYFVLLGVHDGGDPPDSAGSIGWILNSLGDFGIGPETPSWIFFDAGFSPLYYSLSNVATPDLATNWKNASDDSPASITVASVTVGQLVSGWKLGSVVYQVNGAQNGRNLLSDVLGVAPSIGWDTTKWTNGTTNGSGNTAFPDIGTADPVASESNWGPVP